MTDLAIYDMDRTVTRRATYTPFLLHCAARRAPWRLLFLPLVESFADATVAGNIRPGARKAIDRDKSEGRRLVLATASYRLYADAIAERLGFDDVIGTGSVIGLDERIRSRISGENAYGEAKLRMIADWVEKSGLTGKHGHVRFYSDHASDAPTFEWAHEPVAVNPHARLARLAIRRGWAIEDWG